MDGNGALFGTLQGNTREVLHKFTVDLPKKHGRGGQSALRFARLRMEKRHNYVRKVAETAVTLYIVNDKPNVAGLVLAGSADFKTELSQSDMFDPVSRNIVKKLNNENLSQILSEYFVLIYDYYLLFVLFQRLQGKVIKLVDVSYGGENGFNQAIELAAESLANVKFIQEKKLIGKWSTMIGIENIIFLKRVFKIYLLMYYYYLISGRYFEEISLDTGKYCFGVVDTLKALECGSVETLICWENLDIIRFVLKNHQSGEDTILHLTPEQEKDKTHFTDKATGVEYELVDSMPLLEWLANNYKNFGSTLEIITDRSQEGSQYVRGFGGIGGEMLQKSCKCHGRLNNLIHFS